MKEIGMAILTLGCMAFVAFIIWLGVDLGISRQCPECPVLQCPTCNYVMPDAPPLYYFCVEERDLICFQWEEYAICVADIPDGCCETPTTPMPCNCPTQVPEVVSPTPTQHPAPTPTPQPPMCYQWLIHKPGTAAEQLYCCDSDSCVRGHISGGHADAGDYCIAPIVSNECSR